MTLFFFTLTLIDYQGQIKKNPTQTVTFILKETRLETWNTLIEDIKERCMALKYLSIVLTQGQILKQRPKPTSLGSI